MYRLATRTTATKNVSLMHFILFVNFKISANCKKIAKYELFYHRNLICGINLSLGFITRGTKTDLNLARPYI
jgi:hypothetical protein